MIDSPSLLEHVPKAEVPAIRAATITDLMVEDYVITKVETNVLFTTAQR
jgi:hypothetical protein